MLAENELPLFERPAATTASDRFMNPAYGDVNACKTAF